MKMRQNSTYSEDVWIQVFLANYYLGDQIEEDELGETYAQERIEMNTGFGWSLRIKPTWKTKA